MPEIGIRLLPRFSSTPGIIGSTAIGSENINSGMR